MFFCFLNVSHISTTPSSLHLRLPSTFGFPSRFRCPPGHNPLQTPPPYLLYLCRTLRTRVCGVHTLLTHRVASAFPGELLGRYFICYNQRLETEYMISQEIPLVLWNLKFRWRVHMTPPLVPVLNQITRIHALPSHFFKISFHAILPNTPTFSVVSFLRVSPPKPYMHSSFHPYEPHAQTVSFALPLSPK